MYKWQLGIFLEITSVIMGGPWYYEKILTKSSKCPNTLN